MDTIKAYKIKIALENMLGIYTNDDENVYIGLIPSNATWLKEGDTISKDSVILKPMYEKYKPYKFKYTEIQMQCPCCNKYVFSASFKE